MQIDHLTVGVKLVSDREMARLNQLYHSKTYEPTDVLTFAYMVIH